MNAIVDRRRRIMLAAIRLRQPASIEAVRRLPEIQLWSDDAYLSTLDRLVAEGLLVEGPTGRPVALAIGGVR